MGSSVILKTAQVLLTPLELRFTMISGLQNKAVRDLAWVIMSPSLIANQKGWPMVEPAITSDWISEWLMALDAEPEPLIGHLQQESSHFLGTYFESLWAFYLNAMPHIDLIARNLQVRTRKKTIGEFDFIILDHNSNQFIHQEIAIKFYLGIGKPNQYPFTDGQNLWYGPQCRDRLDLKMDKMLNSQIHLSTTEFGKRALQTLNIDTIETQLVVRGYLFYPEDQSVTAPVFCNPAHLNGRWVSLSQFLKEPESYLHPTQPNHGSEAWQLLSKQSWLSRFEYPPASNRHQPSTDFFTDQAGILNTVENRVKGEGRPWMLACLQKRQERLIEYHRLFVVPDGWPDIFNTPH